MAPELVDERFDRKLKDIPSISQDITGAGVRRLFVERSGMIREPVVGEIDFTHRTFQEFLAAKAAADEMDIGVLVTNAHNDQWREVIILATGLATKQMRDELINRLITRGDTESVPTPPSRCVLLRNICRDRSRSERRSGETSKPTRSA